MGEPWPIQVRLCTGVGAAGSSGGGKMTKGPVSAEVGPETRPSRMMWCRSPYGTVTVTTELNALSVPLLPTAETAYFRT